MKATSDGQARTILDARALSRRWGIGERQAYEFIHSGQVFSFRVGRRLLVPLRAVEAFEAGQLSPVGSEERQ